MQSGVPWASLVCLGQSDVVEMASQEATAMPWASLVCLGQPDVLELASQEATGMLGSV